MQDASIERHRHRCRTIFRDGYGLPYRQGIPARFNHIIARWQRQPGCGFCRLLHRSCIFIASPEDAPRDRHVQRLASLG